MDFYRAKQSFNPEEIFGTKAEEASCLLSVENGDLFEILEEIEDGLKTWIGVRALRDNAVGFIPAKYVKVDKHCNAPPVSKANAREIQLAALEELKKRPEFQHPDLLYGEGMIPEPDYSDSEEDTENNPVDIHRMIKMSPQPIRASTNLNGHSIAEDGLILPRKISNPCLESKEKLDLHRELKFNQKIGKNVLGQKSELKKAMDKFQGEQKKKELEVAKLSQRTSLEKRLEEQAQKLKMVEDNSTDKEKTELGPESEFQRIHAKVRAKVEPH